MISKSAKELYEEARMSRIHESKSMTFLDAVFNLHRYNTRERPTIFVCDIPAIQPSEVFGHVDVNAYQDALNRVEKLMREGYDASDAGFRLAKVPEDYEKLRNDFKKRNPGFSDLTYGRAATDGMQDAMW